MLKEHLQDTLHAIINNVPYAVWLKDTEGTYVLANKAYEEYKKVQASPDLFKFYQDF